jgi:hypothetical protein
VKVDTGAGRGLGAGARLPATEGATVDAAARGRWTRVAPLVVLLVSDERSYVSATEVPVASGMTAHGGATSISDAVRTTS